MKSQIMKSLIYDENEVRRFVNDTIKPLEDDEVYILLLTMRKKWCKSISRSEEGLGRELIRENGVDNVLRKIRKLSNINGIYVDRNTLVEPPIESYGLYILLDPRSTLKGYREFISDISEWQYVSIKGKSKNLELYRRIDLKLFSAIHRNRSRALYSVVDIDKKDEDTLDEISKKLKGNVQCISETHGGYHILAESNYETGRIIYLEIAGKYDHVEILNEPITVIPGTVQGGFEVKRLEVNC